MSDITEPLKEMVENEIASTKKETDNMTKLRKELKEKLSKADSLIERLEATLEFQEKKAELDRNKPTPGLKILGSHNEPDVLELAAQRHLKPGNYYRWVQRHPTIYDARRGRGLAPVLDEAGEKVVVGDEILMHMPERKFTEEFVKPKEFRKRASRKQVVDNFVDAAREDKVKTFGKIQYDDGMTIEVGDHE